MNWDAIKGDWKNFKGKIREEWGDLTDDEVMEMEGKREQVISALQAKYGWTKSEAEKKADDWARRMDAEVAEIAHSSSWRRAEGEWMNLKGKFKEAWADFNDDEIGKLEGRRDQIVGALQRKYGWSSGEAGDKADQWLDAHMSHEAKEYKTAS